MDISNLKEGMVVKNYKKMCELLGEKRHSGASSKHKQLENWKRYFKWHNEGYQFIIEEIYKSVKDSSEVFNETEENSHMENVDKLEIGMVVKSYKELCKLLNQHEKTGGNSRDSQFKEWSRYFKWHKEGYKFVIDEIYDIPQDKLDGRFMGNNSVYSNEIQEILLYTLAIENSGRVCWGCTNLLKQLSMVNKDYSLKRNNIPKFSEEINIKEDYIYDFYNNAHRSLKQKVETALNTLNRRSLVNWRKVVMLCTEHVDIEKNDFGTPKLVNGKLSYKKSIIHRRATPVEEEMILDLERDTIIEMGFDDKRDVFLNGKWRDFKSSINKSLKEKGNIDFYYEAYEIIYTRKHINALLGLPKVSETRLELNKKIAQGLYQSAETRHENAKDKLNEVGSKIISTNDELKANLEYAPSNKALVNKLIALNGNSFIE